MRNQLFKFAVLVVVISAFCFADQAFSQYDDQQIQFVINKLKEKNLLGNLIDLTRADSKQSATRADLLVACYLIVRYMDDNSDIAGLNKKLTQLENSLKNLERQGTRSASEGVLVQRVLEQVEKKIKTDQPQVEMNQELNELRTNIRTIENRLEHIKFEKLEQRVHDNTVIASAAVVLSLIITIFAAR